MVLLALLEGQSLSAFIGVCLLILGVVTFVWNQRAWEIHTYLGRAFLFLLSASLLSGGLMFLGLVNYLEYRIGH
jgi:multisubunit Na+/H+ antiporter MnhG subunit